MNQIDNKELINYLNISDIPYKIQTSGDIRYIEINLENVSKSQMDEINNF